MRRLPIGIQTFTDLIEGGYLYVDKTKQVYNLANGDSKYVFLSRPRRFGKSLLTSTLRSYFEGRKDLFEGLAIAELETKWMRHPVLHFDMSKAKHMDEARLEDYLSDVMEGEEKRFGFTREHELINTRLEDLVKFVTEKYGQKAVVLIDEYDAPLLDVLHENENLLRLRQIMRNFYSPLKALDPYLRFVFLTGITKFSQLSIFSELNNIRNISMSDRYADICGITLDELVTQMRPEVERFAEANEQTFDEAVTQLRKQYDGYHFSAKSPDIFNPFSLLNCFSEDTPGNFWFGSGTPTYLIEMMRKYGTLPTDIGELTETNEAEFDVAPEYMTNILPLMYQSGYLTIKSYSPISKIYALGIPNDEVRIGLMGSLLPNYIGRVGTHTTIGKMAQCFYDNDVKGAFTLLSTFLETVPYCNNTAYEGHWQQMLYVVLSLFGAYGNVEVHTATGRVDMAMILWGKLYLVEVKIDKTVDEALCQIDLKGYDKRFALADLPVVRVGVNFDTVTHRMDFRLRD